MGKGQTHRETRGNIIRNQYRVFCTPVRSAAVLIGGMLTGACVHLTLLPSCSMGACPVNPSRCLITVLAVLYVVVLRTDRTDTVCIQYLGMPQ